jgi:hypothetical protein
VSDEIPTVGCGISAALGNGLSGCRDAASLSG